MSKRQGVDIRPHTPLKKFGLYSTITTSPRQLQLSEDPNPTSRSSNKICLIYGDYVTLSEQNLHSIATITNSVSVEVVKFYLWTTRNKFDTLAGQCAIAFNTNFPVKDRSNLFLKDVLFFYMKLEKSTTCNLVVIYNVQALWDSEDKDDVPTIIVFGPDSSGHEDFVRSWLLKSFTEKFSAEALDLNMIQSVYPKIEITAPEDSSLMMLHCLDCYLQNLSQFSPRNIAIPRFSSTTMRRQIVLALDNYDECAQMFVKTW